MPGTVTVASKLPLGLLLRLFKMDDRDEPVMGGGIRTSKIAREIGATVEIMGAAAPFGQYPKAPVQGGYALTPNVDADFFNAWLAQNSAHPAVVNHLIFAHERPGVANDKAREHASIRSGLEPVDPNRLPKKIEAAAA